MRVKKHPSDIYYSLESIRKTLDSIISNYLEDYADYGWDSFTEDISNISAQLYKDEIMLRNAEVSDGME